MASRKSLGNWDLGREDNRDVVTNNRPAKPGKDNGGAGDSVGTAATRESISVASRVDPVGSSRDDDAGMGAGGVGVA